MKRTILTFMLSFVSVIALMAQSSLVCYPNGYWLGGQDDDDVISAELYITRFNEEQIDFNNKMGCGTLSIYNNKTDKFLYEGMLTYVARGVGNDGYAVDGFFFDVTSKNGNKSRIIVTKRNTTKGNVVVISNVTGEISKFDILKEAFIMGPPGNGAAYDPSPEFTTNKELIEGLRDAPNISWNTKGFGNRQQYINAHAKLIDGKHVYAKCKSAGSVNIRKSPNATSEKIGELVAGTTLYVHDEYNGWCFVKLDTNRYGWVSLSVVNLTNTPSATTTITASATQTSNASSQHEAFPVDKIVNWCKSWGGNNLTSQKLIANMKSLGFILRRSGRDMSFEDYLFTKGCAVNNDGDLTNISGKNACAVLIMNDIAEPANITFDVVNQQDYNTILNHAKTHMKSSEDYSSKKTSKGWQVKMSYHDGYY